MSSSFTPRLPNKPPCTTITCPSKMCTMGRYRKTSTTMEKHRSSYLVLHSRANPPQPLGGAGWEQMATSSWLPRFRYTHCGQARYDAKRITTISVEHGPRSTKSPLKMNLFCGEGRPASSKMWSRSVSWPWRSPTMCTRPGGSKGVATCTTFAATLRTLYTSRSTFFTALAESLPPRRYTSMIAVAVAGEMGPLGRGPNSRAFGAGQGVTFSALGRSRPPTDPSFSSSSPSRPSSW
mmetsp:Transcript_70735/g.160003  ORF Transcript_70735/g.160003 Transcript_70735/m.160003 type:complete len:236 (-) Transcript_70735:433-1140(-)